MRGSERSIADPPVKYLGILSIDAGVEDDLRGCDAASPSLCCSHQEPADSGPAIAVVDDEGLDDHGAWLFERRTVVGMHQAHHIAILLRDRRIVLVSLQHLLDPLSELA